MATTDAAVTSILAIMTADAILLSGLFYSAASGAATADFAAN